MAELTQAQMDLLQADFPGLLDDLAQAIAQAPKPANYLYGRLEIQFEGIAALILDGQGNVLEERAYDATYRPRLMTVRGDGELIFIKVDGQVKLNRLPGAGLVA